MKDNNNGGSSGQENFRAIFQNAPVGMVIMDNSEGITQINLAASRLFHKDKRDIIGRRIGDALNCVNSFKGKLGCGSSEECSKCTLRKMLMEVSSTGGSYHGLEIEHILLIDGLEKKKWYTVNADPVIIDGGKSIVITLDDITEKKLLEQRIAKSREFYLTLFENFPMLIWRADINGKRNYFNKSWLAFRGRPVHHEVGYGWMNGINPEDKDTYVMRYMSSVKNHSPIDLYYRLKNSSGEFRWMHEIGRPYRDLDGNFEGYVGVLLDVTEPRIAEEGMKRYQLLSENAYDAILFVDIDGNIVEANKASLDLYGYTMDELLTKTIFDLRGVKDEKSKRQVNEQLKRAEEEGIIFESVHYSKNGDAIPVEVSSQFAQIGDNKLHLSIVRDTRDRKEQEKVLQESEEKFRTLFQSGNDPIFVHEIIDKEKMISKFIEVNAMACRKLGYSRDELLRMGPRDLIPERFLDSRPEILKNIVSNKHYTYETVYVTREKLEIPLEVSSHFFYMSNKEVILSIARDISDRKKVEDELKKAKEAAENASRAKSDFLANMSHEIRTPLNGIIGMIDMTLISPLNSEQKENLSIAKTSADSLLRVINDILDFSKVEAGKLSLSNTNFNLRKLIEETIKVHYARANEKGIELIQQYHGNIPSELYGDPSRLKQILDNLLGNAIKFTEYGEITLSIKNKVIDDRQIELCFAISDTGIGIDEKDVEKLFKSFSQADETNARKYGGTGLGLAISKKLVEMMGGQIWLETQKGKGSCFSFTVNLPVSDTTEVAVEKKILKERKKTGMHILLAEDDRVNQLFTTKILEKEGHQITLASNGLEVLDKLREKQFDIILMDIQMPEMDGVEATKKIREAESPGSGHIPIVALTAHAIQGDREKYLASGMDEYLSKPFEIEDLFNVLDKVGQCNHDKGINNTFSWGGNIEEPLLYQAEDDARLKDLIVQEGNKLLETLSCLKNVCLMEDATAETGLSKMENAVHALKIKFDKAGMTSMKNLTFKLELCLRRRDYLGGKELIIELINEFEKTAKLKI